MFILPKKKSLEKPSAGEPPARSAKTRDDPGELKNFVDNYLTLADKALGFKRQPGPNDQLTISICLSCQHTIAATSLKLLAFAESLHVCPAKRASISGRGDAAA